MPSAFCRYAYRNSSTQSETNITRSVAPPHLLEMPLGADNDGTDSEMSMSEMSCMTSRTTVSEVKGALEMALAASYGHAERVLLAQLHLTMKLLEAFEGQEDLDPEEKLIVDAAVAAIMAGFVLRKNTRDAAMVAALSRSGSRRSLMSSLRSSYDYASNVPRLIARVLDTSTGGDRESEDDMDNEEGDEGEEEDGDAYDFD